MPDMASNASDVRVFMVHLKHIFHDRPMQIYTIEMPFASILRDILHKKFRSVQQLFFKSSALSQKSILNLDLMVYLEEIEPDEE